jgi:hypothetical protein
MQFFKSSSETFLGFFRSITLHTNSFPALSFTHTNLCSCSAISSSIRETGSNQYVYRLQIMCSRQIHNGEEYGLFLKLDPILKVKLKLAYPSRRNRRQENNRVVNEKDKTSQERISCAINHLPGYKMRNSSIERRLETKARGICLCCFHRDQ